MADPPAFLQKAGDMMVHFVDGFIEFDKPLIAMVNGPGNFSQFFALLITAYESLGMTHRSKA